MVKVSDVAKAIREDGLEQGFGWYFHDREGHPISENNTTSKPIYTACALGMAAINLKTTTESLNIELNRFLDDKTPVAQRIAHLNDNVGLSFNQIADWLETWAQENNDPELGTEEHQYSEIALKHKGTPQ